MQFGSVCSGIEAASVAFAPLGWRAAWLAEIEPFPCAVLAYHYPQVPNLGDMTTIARRVLTGEVSAPDVLCGGTPCQAFSVAGLRQSLADERGNLSLKFVELADAIDHVRVGRGEDECIVFWENVPGVLSTKDNAFGCFLAGLAGEDEPLQPPGGKWANAGAVYGPARAVAWRTLDAQYFGVAQRRRRVFVVASARKGFDPATVLFEWDGVRRDTAPSREARQTAPTIPARSTAGGGLGTDFDCDGGLIKAYGGNNQSGPIDVATARNACASASGRMDFETETFLVQPTHTLRGEGFDASEDGTGRGTPLIPVAVQASQSGVRINDTIGTLDANYGSRRHNGVMHGMQVRRLTPTEAERLQGFPDGYTAIPWRKKPADQCPDGPRYRALGNSWAIPVVRWIGQRIDSVLSRGQTRPSHVEAAQKRSTPESGEQRRDRTGS
ncbi:MAG: DNA cytosine methyltransferase [Alicycliphilus denitrificans]|nr:DNA cytosine methyltransferase [Alicycliphilus denitrificans]